MAVPFTSRMAKLLAEETVNSKQSVITKKILGSVSRENENFTKIIFFLNNQ